MSVLNILTKVFRHLDKHKRAYSLGFTFYFLLFTFYFLLFTFYFLLLLWRLRKDANRVFFLISEKRCLEASANTIL